MWYQLSKDDPGTVEVGLSSPLPDATSSLYVGVPKQMAAQVLQFCSAAQISATAVL